ncbi:MAG: hypothetical protein R3A52_19690 [Polyangiales bacterium]
MLGGLAIGNADCAQERDPIDRTQPGRVDKHFFVGANLRDSTDNPEFYVNNYVVDASGSNNMVPVGTYDEVDRIRWEIQENVLLARKAYEYVTNSDGRGVAGPTNNGLIVAAYRIDSHFDVRRAYNPTTGEEINVVEENRTDRPWYDREYMRVDWSQNLVDNPDWGGLFYGSIFGDLSFQPVRYYEQDPRSPNAPNFCEMQPGMVRGADGACVQATNPRHHNGGYFDVTSKWLVSPEMSNAFGFPLPTCLITNFFTGSDVYDCNPQESVIRTSFRRIEDRDFQPLEMTRQPYDLVGGPRATRNAFDPNFGTLDRNFHRYQMVHNLWVRSHWRNAEGNPVSCSGRDANGDGIIDGNLDANSDGTADVCAAGGAPRGSQCDGVMEQCTIPYRDREVRPIAYYLNPETPPEFQDHVETENADGTLSYRLPNQNEYGTAAVTTGASEQIINTWDLAVRRAVASAREVECRKLGEARDVCHNRFFNNDLVPQEDGAFLGDSPKATPEGATAVERGVVVCHNPVRSTDSSACREVGYSVRLGDIRYNHMTYIPGFSRAPFGGIAHWGYDPLTGEIVSNGAVTMGRSVEYAAGQQRDYIRLILHEIDPSLDPLTLSAWLDNAPATALQQYIRNPAANRVGSGRTQITPELIAERIASADHNHAAQSVAGRVPSFGNDIGAGLRYDARMIADTTPAGVSQTAAAFQSQANLIRGTTLETEMIDQQWLRAAGINPQQALASLDSNTLDRVSPLRRMDPEWATAMRDRFMSQLEARGFCFQDAGAAPLVGSSDMQGVARWFAQRYRSLTPEARAARIMQDLRVDAFKGIALHEVGHSMGLYHLPVSSYDSSNYNPQYWQLRTRGGAAARSCRPDTCQPGQCDSIRNADRNNDNCMGPRYLDPETDEELGIRALDAGNHHAGLTYFGNTSTMEYQWERFGETVGLGAYDVYAMGILYGRVVETMERDTARGGMPVDQQRRFVFNLRSQLQNRDLVYWNDPQTTTSTAAPNLSGIHYTELARQLNLFDPSRCRDATPEEQARYRWRIVDGKICAHAPRDHASLTDMETSEATFTGPAGTDSEAAAPSWRVRAGTPDSGAPIADGQGPLRWRYRVAWDRGTGYPHINYFDQGADLYEVTRSITRKYDLLYPAMYFRRGNREWASWAVSSSVASRMFRLVRGYHWNVARDIALYRSFYSDTTFARFAAADGGLGPTMAVQPEMFDFFSRVMLTPEVGVFESADGSNPNGELRLTPEMRQARQAIFDATDFPANPQFSIGVVDGRYIGDDYDNGQGGSLDYQSYARREGAYMEKSFAAIMLTDTRPTFSSITRGLYLDGREFQVNFATDIPGALDRLLGGILSEDWAAVAMHAPAGAPGSEATPEMLQLWRDTPTRPNGARVLFPNVGYRQQLPTIIYSMLFSSLNTDLTLINKMRIFTEGGVEQVDIPEAERVRFYNPETGVTYVARRYGADTGLTALVSTPSAPRTVDRGIASRMLQHANALLMDAFLVQRDMTTGARSSTRRASRRSSATLPPASRARRTPRRSVEPSR